MRQVQNILLVPGTSNLSEADSAMTRAELLAKRYGAHVHIAWVPGSAARRHPLIPSILRGKAKERDEATRREILEALVSQREGEWKILPELDEDSDLVDCVLRQASTISADLIIKEVKQAHFLLGLARSPDWELLRHAALPVWFTRDECSPASGVLAALECVVEGDGEDEDAALALDLGVADAAQALAQQFEGNLHLVHAFEVPDIAEYANYYPAIDTGHTPAGEVYEAEEKARLTEVSLKHGAAITEFARAFDVSTDDIKVVRGQAADVIEQQARELKAGVVVMGAAHDKGRWERFSGQAAAEPTLTAAPCDVLFLH